MKTIIWSMWSETAIDLWLSGKIDWWTVTGALI